LDEVYAALQDFYPIPLTDKFFAAAVARRFLAGKMHALCICAEPVWISAIVVQNVSEIHTYAQFGQEKTDFFSSGSVFLSA
jgi:hypothetical protein